MAGRASRATISARGGTTGRAAGCPTKFGFAGGRNGPPLPCPSAGSCGAAAPGMGRGAVGRGGVGIVGTAAPGRGVPGVVIMVGGAGCAARQPAEAHSIPARAWEHRSPATASAGAGRKESGRAAAVAARSAKESRARGSPERSAAHRLAGRERRTQRKCRTHRRRRGFRNFQRELPPQDEQVQEQPARELSSPRAARVRQRELRAGAQVLRAAPAPARTLRQARRPQRCGGGSARHHHRANWSASSYQ